MFKLDKDQNAYIFKGERKKKNLENNVEASDFYRFAPEYMDGIIR